MPSRKKIFATLSDDDLMRIINDEATHNPGDFSSGNLTEGVSHHSEFARATAARTIPQIVKWL